MRRPIASRISIFFLFCVAIFSLFSFIFDQFVINQEKKIRILNQKFFELENLSIDLWNKEFSYIITHSRLGSLVSDTNLRFEIFINLANISKDKKYLDSIRSTNKSRYASYYNSVFRDFISEIDYRFMQVMLNSRLQLTNKDQKEYDKKFKKDYYEIGDSIQLIKKKVDKFSKNPINTKLLLTINNDLKNIYEKIHLLGFKFHQESEFVSNKTDSIETNMEAVGLKITDEIGKKNIYILLSVGSQILSLLFLTLLFRVIMVKIHRPNVMASSK